MTKTITFTEWQKQAQALRLRSERLSRSIVAEARRTAQQAGLSPDICFLHAHNALCGLHYGKPWPEVNYSLARKVLWLEQKSFEPSRIVDSINSRAFKTIQY